MIVLLLVLFIIGCIITWVGVLHKCDLEVYRGITLIGMSILCLIVGGY